MPWTYGPQGHKAVPRRVTPDITYCGVCYQQLTFIKQTNQPDQWRHPRRKRE